MIIVDPLSISDMVSYSKQIEVGDIVTSVDGVGSGWPDRGFTSMVYRTYGPHVYVADSESPHFLFGQHGWGYLRESVKLASKEEAIKYMNRNHLNHCRCNLCEQ